MGSMKDLFGDKPFELKRPPQPLKTDALARDSDPITSQIGAQKARVGDASQLVLDIITAGPDKGMHKDNILEASENLGRQYRCDSIGPRLKELTRKGLIMCIGTRMANRRVPQQIYLDMDRALRLGHTPYVKEAKIKTCPHCGEEL